VKQLVNLDEFLEILWLKVQEVEDEDLQSLMAFDLEKWREEMV
jgi:hypothetical protein